MRDIFLQIMRRAKNKRFFFKLKSSSNIKNAAVKNNKDLIEIAKKQVRMQQRNEMKINKFNRDNKLVVRTNRDN
jgi:hypothetical protein